MMNSLDRDTNTARADAACGAAADLGAAAGRVRDQSFALRGEFEAGRVPLAAARALPIAASARCACGVRRYDEARVAAYEARRWRLADFHRLQRDVAECTAVEVGARLLGDVFIVRRRRPKRRPG